MKKMNLVKTISLCLAMFGLGCATPNKKVELAESKVQDAKENLVETKKDAAIENQRLAKEEEWRKFKQESEVQISNNASLITQFKKMSKKSNSNISAMYDRTVYDLEQRNNNLRTKMDIYEKRNSDWYAFKNEFKRDMDELGIALKDFTIKNK